ncbi:MAG: histidine triad nucleotide-binding protein [Clostridia bacterium]|nr:histidine triad nucleotide-binding protein [Clostridia bacterium]
MSDCLFCKIANGDIPTEFLYEDDKVVAFKDIEPQAPHHILIIPKEHIDSALEINDANCDIPGHVFMVASKLAKELGFAQDGFRIVNNCGRDGGQTVGHLHFHILAGRYLQWPPG